MAMHPKTWQSTWNMPMHPGTWQSAPEPGHTAQNMPQKMALFGDTPPEHGNAPQNVMMCPKLGDAPQNMVKCPGYAECGDSGDAAG